MASRVKGKIRKPTHKFEGKTYPYTHAGIKAFHNDHIGPLRLEIKAAVKAGTSCAHLRSRLVGLYLERAFMGERLFEDSGTKSSARRGNILSSYLRAREQILLARSELLTAGKIQLAEIARNQINLCNRKIALAREEEAKKKLTST